ncbi:MAG: radical SAM/SPASM domain-containing protein [Candidatus Omnitrophica bacterium]|nr:radical SAM/SPASM domain-containing protein [Candidatus Omnitrophota bacterium]
MIPSNNDMRFEVTTRCNYNCVLCPRDKITRKIETMSLELFKELFDKINKETPRYDTLTFPGMGEPLLDETLDEKIEYARRAHRQSRDLSVLILTNGYLLTPERFAKLEQLGVASVRVSIYGNDPSGYSRVHGIRDPKAFDKVRDNLVKICAIKKRTRLLLTFNVVEGINDSAARGWIDFWGNKADLIEVWNPHNWVDARQYRRVQREKLATCGRPFEGPLQVQVDGTVNMCCFDFDGKLTLGDLKEQSLDEIFSSPACMKIAECHRSGNFRGSGLICENCDQRNKAKGDVMVYNSKFDIKERVRMISTTYKKVG